MNHVNESQNFGQVTFQRSPHNKENPYAQINRSLIRDATLSPECRFLLIYLLSHSDNWKIRISQIWKHVKNFMGRDRLYNLINEAIEAGYMKREMQKAGNLNNGYIYYVSEEVEFKKCFRRPDFQDAGGSDAESQESTLLYKKEHLKEEKEEKEKEESVAAAPSSISSRKKIKEEKEEVAPKVFLTPTQQKHFLKKVDERKEFAKKCYEKLSDWKIGKGIEGGKNDYKALCDWVIKAIRDELLRSSYSNYQIEENRKLAEQIWNKFKNRGDIELGYKYIEFKNGQTVAHIEFDDKDFKITCLTQLKKRNLEL